MTNAKLMTELKSLETECAKIVSSIHCVIPAAMAKRLWELRDEAEARNLKAA